MKAVITFSQTKHLSIATPTKEKPTKNRSADSVDRRDLQAVQHLHETVNLLKHLLNFKQMLWSRIGSFLPERQGKRRNAISKFSDAIRF